MAVLIAKLARLAREENMYRLILALMLATACASTPENPIRPAAYVRDDSAAPDLVQARRDYAGCDAESRIAYDTAPRELLVFGVPRKRYRRAMDNCMRSHGWILLPEARTEDPLPDGALPPEMVQCAGKTC